MSTKALQHLFQGDLTQHPEERLADERMNLDLLKQFLQGRRFCLDCGHFSTPTHNFGTTMIVLAEKTPKIICFNCYL
jgi:hypothetical protein